MAGEHRTLSAANGRWPEILASIANLSDEFLTPTNKEGPCPSCGGETRYRWDQSDGDGAWYCSHCGGKSRSGGGGNGIDLLCRLQGWSFPEACSHVDQWLGLDSPNLRSMPPGMRPQSTARRPRPSERVAWDWLVAAAQIGEGEGYSPNRARGRSYSARWLAWSEENPQLAESIILESELTIEIIDPTDVKSTPKSTGPIDLSSVRESLQHALDRGTSRSDLEELVINLANRSEQNAGNIRYILRALEQERRLEDQIAIDRQRITIAADRAEISAALITLEELMPQSLAKAIAQRMKHLPADDITSAGVFLAATAGVIKLGSEIIASQSDSFIVPLNLFAALVGNSGSKKGPIEKLLVSHPIRPIREDLSRHNARALQDWREANHNAKPADRTEPPSLIHAVVSQFTGESLDRQLAIQEQAGLGLFVHRDELAGLFGFLNAYRGGRGGDSEQLLEAYDGQGSSSLRISTDGGGRFYSRCQLSIFGTIQPAVLNRLVADGDASGLWARFLFLPLPARVVPLPPEETDEEIQASEDAAALLERVIGSIYRLPPTSLRLDREARRVFMTYEARCQGDALQADLDAQRAAWSKAPGKVLRVAGLLHLLHRVCPDGEHSEEVSTAMITRASNLVDHLTGWSLGIHEAAASGDTTDVMRLVHGCAQRVGGPAGWGMIMSRMSKKQREQIDSAAALAAAEALVEMGYGELMPGRRGWQYKATKPLPD